MKVVLFCGGPGVRPRQDAAPLPKSMMTIGDRPLLWHVMRYYAHFGHTDFILCLGYGASVIKDYFLRYDETLSADFTLLGGGRDLRLSATDITDWTITFVDTGLNSTIGERLMRVRRHVEDEPIFLANYADTLTDARLPELIERFRRDRAVAAMLAVPARPTRYALDFGARDQVTRILPVRDLVPWQCGGYFLFRPEIFGVLRDGEDLMPHAFDRLLSDGRLTAWRYTGFWQAVESMRDRTELEEHYLAGDCPWMVWDRRPAAVTAPAAPVAVAAPPAPRAEVPAPTRAAPVALGMPAVPASRATNRA